MFWPVTLELLRGFWETVKIFLLTLAFSIPLGLVVCFGSMSGFRPLRYVTRTFVWIIRGTPLMLQLILVFYGPGLLFDLPSMGRFQAVILAFSINYACYFSEIYRGGIESIPRGQYAPMSNEVITLVKDTSLARIIAVYEIIYMGQSFIKKGLIWPLFYTGAFYLVFSGVLTVLFDRLEKKLAYFRG